MKAVFKFYDPYGYKFGEIECDDKEPKFRHLVASGYHYCTDLNQQSMGLNRVDTRGEFERIKALD